MTRRYYYLILIGALFALLLTKGAEWVLAVVR